MSVWLMKVHGDAFSNLEVPRYLHTFDIEKSEYTLTTMPDEAHPFKTFDDVLETWSTQSTTTPLRTDGKPNRPLTVLTVEPEEYDPF